VPIKRLLGIAESNFSWFLVESTPLGEQVARFLWAETPVSSWLIFNSVSLLKIETVAEPCATGGCGTGWEKSSSE